MYAKGLMKWNNPTLFREATCCHDSTVPTGLEPHGADPTPMWTSIMPFFKSIEKKMSKLQDRVLLDTDVGVEPWHARPGVGSYLATATPPGWPEAGGSRRRAPAATNTCGRSRALTFTGHHGQTEFNWRRDKERKVGYLIFIASFPGIER